MDSTSPLAENAPCGANIVLITDKSRIARELARAQREIDPEIRRIVRVMAVNEQDSTEPVKLLEVNPYTSPSGILPIAFGAVPPQIPYSSVIIEVTEGEFTEVNTGRRSLPHEWQLGETLYPAGI